MLWRGMCGFPFVPELFWNSLYALRFPMPFKTIHGNTIIWQTFCKKMAIPWQTHGKYWCVPGDGMGNELPELAIPRQTHGKHQAVAWQPFCQTRQLHGKRMANLRKFESIS